MLCLKRGAMTGAVLGKSVAKVAKTRIFPQIDFLDTIMSLP